MTTSGGRRDLATTRAGIAAWCAAARPDLAAAGIEDVRHPSSGMSNETLIVQFGATGGSAEGPRLVVRLPPVQPSFPDQDIALVARVQERVAASGIPTPSPVTVVADPSWLGVPFVVMPFVEGTIPGQASLFDPWLLDASPAQRRAAQSEMVRVLAVIQGVDWRRAGLGDLLAGAGPGREDRLGEQLDLWDRYLGWATAGERLPRLEAVLDWCRTHRPTDDVAPALVWGDPRLENLVMDEERRVRSVLDWELATIGPPEMDLGWYLALERVLLELTGREPLDGMAHPDEVAAEYATAIGRPLQDLAWHEVFALFRSICITTRQAAISAAAGVRYVTPPGEANPLLPLAEAWIAARP